MTAKLVAVNGPLRKSEFVIRGELSLGQDSSNVLRLEDSWVSPHHCVIAEQDGRFVVTDLDSSAGTFVNGIPARQRELTAGDEIAVGNSLFVFQFEKDSFTRMGDVRIDPQVVSKAYPAEALPVEMENLAPAALASLSSAMRMERNLGALVRISRAIGSLRDEESLPWQLLGMTFDVIPAERGAVLLFEDRSTEIRAQVAWDRVSGPEHPVHISKQLVTQVVDGKQLLWSSSPDFGKSADSAAFLCAPMLGEQSVLGILYLESGPQGPSFTRNDLELLAAISALGVIGISNARRFQQLSSENQRLRAEADLTHDMVGRSQKMREIYQFIERIAASDSTVLIYGESGTGKELAARAIHKNSSRKDRDFVALNCAAITESLLESELFGHEKGAFTSAVNQKKGFLEVAEGGTIFLDEIGELSPVLQAKLLRVLQEREIVRVGGTRPIKIDVRFLAATNKDLQKAVRDDRFRADLFHRLNVISLTLPALREHLADIPELAAYFAARYAQKCNRRVIGISDAALRCLLNYDWPGNIRELENAIERAVVVGATERILPEDLPESLQERGEVGSSSSLKYHEALRNLKEEMILKSLELAGGNMTEAAKSLGVHANYLHRLIRNLELRPKIKKTSEAR
ncbi:MAG TPA: sigma 54-interacting transcriptional regulator [Candidatus Acidoferrum sp.]|nr:sigma 54-interacting transcriptional regulator [Candidatus Acidoferrum sp.]